MQVAVPYWYYVKGLGRKIVRYSKIMAHDEENSANVSLIHIFVCIHLFLRMLKLSLKLFLYLP